MPRAVPPDSVPSPERPPSGEPSPPSAVDFPAAHSMDTTWFAVDRDGRVAAFDSGEAGAVPVDAYLGEDWGEVADPLTAGPATEVVYDLEAGAHATYGSMLVMALAPGAAPELAALAPFAVHAEVGTSLGPGVQLVAEGVRHEELTAVLARWHEAGRCLGCTTNYFDDEYPSFGHRGVYLYDHDTENWIAGPYRRREVPVAPLAADQLAPALRRKMVPFAGSFAETRSLQPVEVWPSEAWGASYLASDGKTIAAIPGKEREFAKEQGDLAEVAGEEGFVVGPPPVPPAVRKPWWKRLFGG
jgi:hypothetical protein